MVERNEKRKVQHNGILHAFIFALVLTHYDLNAFDDLKSKCNTSFAKPPNDILSTEAKTVTQKYLSYEIGIYNGML